MIAPSPPGTDADIGRIPDAEWIAPHHDKPIIMSAPMVRALLAGTKSQTRRVLKGEPECIDDIPSEHEESHEIENRLFGGPGAWTITGRPVPYAAHDRLWVREAWSGPHDLTGIPPREWGHGNPIWYWADGNPEHGDWTKPKSPIHMPRWASRLTLIVTEVRVERLHSITGADAVAEGVTSRPGGWWGGADGHSAITPVGAYALLWNSIHGPGAWDANPWVAAISFRTVRANIDAMADVA